MKEKEIQLLQAAEELDDDTMEYLICKEHVDPSCVEEETGNTPLHIILSKGDHILAEWLLEHGADPLKANKEGQLPYQKTRLNFLSIVSYGAMLMASLLCKKTAVMQAYIDDAFNVIGKITYRENAEKVLLSLIEKDLLDLTCTTTDQRNLLHLACALQSAPLARVMLDKGVSVNAQTTSGDTALHLAVFKKHEELVALLLARGADAFKANDNHQIAWQVYDIEKYEDFPDISLLYAHAFRKDKQVASYHKAQSFHFFAKIPAIIIEQDKCAKMLAYAERILCTLLKKEEIELRYKTHNGMNFLEIAAANGWRDLTKALLFTHEDHAVFVQEKCDTALEIACREDAFQVSPELVYLLTKKADPHVDLGSYALSHAKLLREARSRFFSLTMPLVTGSEAKKAVRLSTLKEAGFYVGTPFICDMFAEVLENQGVTLPNGVTPKDAFRWMYCFYLLATYVPSIEGLTSILNALPVEMIAKVMQPLFAEHDIVLDWELQLALKAAVGILAIRQESLRFRPEWFLTVMGRQLKGQDQTLSLASRRVRGIWEEKNITKSRDPLYEKQEGFAHQLEKASAGYTALVKQEKDVREDIKAALRTCIERTEAKDGATRDAPGCSKEALEGETLIDVFQEIQRFLEKRNTDKSARLVISKKQEVPPPVTHADMVKHTQTGTGISFPH